MPNSMMANLEGTNLRVDMSNHILTFAQSPRLQPLVSETVSQFDNPSHREIGVTVCVSGALVKQRSPVDGSHAVLPIRI